MVKAVAPKVTRQTLGDHYKEKGWEIPERKKANANDLGVRIETENDVQWTTTAQADGAMILYPEA